MKNKIWLVLCIMLVSFVQVHAKVLNSFSSSVKGIMPVPGLNKVDYDTVFYDNFESDTMGWVVKDIIVQDSAYWHIDSYCPIGAYSGNLWWCGKYDPKYKANPGYGIGWVQYLYSPSFDLTSLTADTVVLNFQHFYSVEGPSGGDDWDCVNLWGTVDGGANWFLLYPDSMRNTPDKLYNLKDSRAWDYMGLTSGDNNVAGWGGSNSGWQRVYFDLSPYKGQNLQLRFSTVSDWAECDEDGGPYNGAWYIDNIQLDTISAGGMAGTFFYDDVESGTNGWVVGVKIPKISWHKTTNRAKSAIHSWYSGEEGTYKHSWGYSDALISPPIDLSKVQNTQPCVASFSMWVDYPGPYSEYTRDWDYFDVEVSSDSGVTWEWMDQYKAEAPQQSWVDVEQALRYYGEVKLNTFIGKTVQVRISVCTDEKDFGGEGLYIDDFIITGKTQEPLPTSSTICLVDNDGNAVDLADNSWTKYLESALANLGYRYSLVTIGYNKTMVPGYLEQYPLVIWNLGSNFDGRVSASYKALTAWDQELLKAYLDNGGKLWMSGQYYFFANGEQLDTTTHPNLWSDYLHLAPENGWSPNITYWGYGVPGDPIGDGLADSLIYEPICGGGYPWTNPFKAYTLNPDTPGVDVQGFMTNDDGSFNGLRYQDAGKGYKFVYTAFPFEAVSAQYKRDTLAARIIGWLLPGAPEYDPPAVPSGLAAVQDYDSVVCTWNANTEPDLAGYNIYRALQVGLPVWVKLGSSATNSFVDKSITAGAIYHYAVTAYDDKNPANQSVFSPWVYLQATDWKSGTGGDPLAGTPRFFALGQNNPNPCGGITSISFSLPVASRVKLSVYNITGQLVKTLVDGQAGAGHHSVAWNGRDQGGQAAATGIYFYRMEAAGADGRRFAQTKRLNLVK